MAAGGASLNQDFITYRGDDVVPIFIVRNASAQPVDISSVSEITWTAARDGDSVAAVTKTKSAGQISFVTNGVDGQFQVAIGKADTAALDGFYLHTAKITDATGNVTTVTVGRMQAGVRPVWTYDAGALATSPLYQVRRLIGDTKPGDQLLFDAEVNWAIDRGANIELAGAECCRSIAASFAREVDIVQGELKTNYSNKAKAYMSMAVDLQQRGMMKAGKGYAGGISQTDKANQVLDTDRVPPQFNIGMFDDLLPVGPVGNQTPTAGAPDFETPF